MEAPKEGHWEIIISLESLDRSEEEPPPHINWSGAQDTLLKKLEEEDIELSATALSRARSKLHEQSMAYF